ncbi:MAG: Uma2 family endonuclease [Planctomycetaceae bacterium]|nr:Uma2 family endonuclease [Planctomycetaceae bacterium]
MSSVLTTASAADIETTTTPEPRPSSRGEPVWELAELYYPRQGQWTEEEYLALGSNRLIEFSDGVLEFLTMPRLTHARVSRFISDMLRAHVEPQRLGETLWAPVSVRLREGKLREPDVLFLRNGRPTTRDVPDGADLVVEVVSHDPKDIECDYEQKRLEYAEAGIPEYWIVDPQTGTITVLTLPAGATEYAVHGEFRPGQQATSVLLPGFAVDVAACFAAGRGEQR